MRKNIKINAGPLMRLVLFIPISIMIWATLVIIAITAPFIILFGKWEYNP